MIDTIKLAYELDGDLFYKLYHLRSKLQKISPNGDIIFEKGFIEELPSHFSGLRIFEDGNKAFFEFSLAKWASDHCYNDKNTSLLDDQQSLRRWVEILSSYLGYSFCMEKFELYRVDLAINYELIGSSWQEFFRCVEVQLGRSEKSTRKYGSTFYYGSRWLGKKIYHKLSEYNAIEKKKRKERGLPALLIKENIVRIELEFRRMYLKRYGLTNIADIGQLRERYIREERKIKSVEQFRKKKLNLGPIEKFICDLVIEKGYKLALEEFKRHKSQAAWYRWKTKLQKEGIYIQALEGSELKVQEQELLRFELKKVA